MKSLNITIIEIAIILAVLIDFIIMIINPELNIMIKAGFIFNLIVFLVISGCVIGIIFCKNKLRILYTFFTIIFAFVAVFIFLQTKTSISKVPVSLRYWIRIFVLFIPAFLLYQPAVVKVFRRCIPVIDNS